MTKWFSTRMQSVCSSLLLGSLGVTANVSPAHAYNERTHQAMTQVAFDIMRLVTYEQRMQGGFTSLSPLAAPSADVNPAEWRRFILAVAEGTYRVLGQDAGLPNYGSCTGVEGLRLHELPRIDGEDVYEYHFEYIDKERDGQNKCTQPQYLRGPLFTRLNASFPHGVMAGSALGTHAAAPDSYSSDWYVFHDPFQVGYAGQVWDWIDRGTAGLVGAISAPFYCLAKLFKGNGLCGREELKEFSNRNNPLPFTRGLMNAGFSKLSVKIPGEWGTGIGHLMNYGPRAQNTWDDIEGFHQERSGWRGRPGMTDLMIMAAGDLLGLCVDPVRSGGARKYEICDGSGLCGTNEVHDDHEASDRRTAPMWRASTLGHTVFTPLDNLAYFGWAEALNDNFPKAATGPIRVTPKELARPLHALGDIAAPHHLIGGLGWGHRIYEPMVEEFWLKLQNMDDPNSTIEQQYEVTRNILARAFVWYQYILTGRNSFTSRYPNDINVRDLISEMGARNYSYILTGNEMTHEGFYNRVPLSAHPARAFPFVDRVHREADKDGRVVKEWIDNDKARISWLLEGGTAGIVAFLTAAADNMTALSCGDGMVTPGELCDDGNQTDGDGCNRVCQEETQHHCDDAWPSHCPREVCGNGVLYSEACDDGNAQGGDGCSPSCTVEAGWSCDVASPSQCTNTCGDGIVTGSETCDPPGSLGCGANCQIIVN